MILVLYIFLFHPDGWKESLQSEIMDLSQKIKSPNTVYHLQNSSVILCENRVIGSASDTVCQDLYSFLQSEDDFDKSRKKKGKGHSFEVIIEFSGIPRPIK